jgi:DNA processing protein
MSFDEVALSDAEKKSLRLIKPDEPTHIDWLIEKSGLSAGELMSALLNLEMTDRIRQLPGKKFARRL